MKKQMSKKKKNTLHKKQMLLEKQ